MVELKYPSHDRTNQVVIELRTPEMCSRVKRTKKGVVHRVKALCKMTNVLVTRVSRF